MISTYDFVIKNKRKLTQKRFIKLALIFLKNIQESALVLPDGFDEYEAHLNALLRGDVDEKRSKHLIGLKYDDRSMYAFRNFVYSTEEPKSDINFMIGQAASFTFLFENIDDDQAYHKVMNMLLEIPAR